MTSQRELTINLAMTISKIKSKIRSEQRLLNKSLNEETKQSVNRKLDGLRYDLQKATQSEKERKFSQKYHKIKFFEKRKLVRIINKLKKDGKQKELFKQRLNLNYIIHYPKTLKYISILNTPSKAEDREQRDSQLATLSEKMLNNQIDAEPELVIFKSNITSSRPATEAQEAGSDNPGEQEDGEENVDNISNDDFFE